MDRERFANEVAKKIGEPFDQSMLHGAGLLVTGMDGTTTLYVASDKPEDTTFVECEYTSLKDRRILFGKNRLPGGGTRESGSTFTAGSLGKITIASYQNARRLIVKINGQPSHVHTEPDEPCR